MIRRGDRSEESRKRERSVSSGRKVESPSQSSNRIRDDCWGRSIPRDPSTKSGDFVESRSDRRDRRTDRFDRSRGEQESSPKRDEERQRTRDLREQRELKEREEAIARREQRRKEREERKAREASSPSSDREETSREVDRSRETERKKEFGRESDRVSRREHDRSLPRDRDVTRDKERYRRDRERSGERDLRRERDRSRSSSRRQRDREYERSSSTSHHHRSTSLATMFSSKLEQLKNDWQAELLEDDLLGNTLSAAASATGDLDASSSSSSAKYASTLMTFLSPRLAGSVLYDQLQAVHGTNALNHIPAVASYEVNDNMIAVKKELIPATTVEEMIDSVFLPLPTVVPTQANEDTDHFISTIEEPAAELETALSEVPAVMAIVEDEPPSFLLGLDDGLDGDFDLYGDLSADVGGGDAENEEETDTAMVVDGQSQANLVAEVKEEALQPALEASVKEEIADSQQAALEQVATLKLFLLPRDETSSSSMLLTDLSINRLSLLCRAARGQNPASTLLQEASALKALFH